MIGFNGAQWFAIEILMAFIGCFERFFVTLRWNYFFNVIFKTTY